MKRSESESKRERVSSISSLASSNLLLLSQTRIYSALLYTAAAVTRMYSCSALALSPLILHYTHTQAHTNAAAAVADDHSIARSPLHFTPFVK